MKVQSDSKYFDRSHENKCTGIAFNFKKNSSSIMDLI